jgi:hypothetical protein
MPDKDIRTDEDKAKDVEKLLKFLEQIRKPYEYMVNQILKFVNHTRRELELDAHHNRGQKTGDEVYDGTALQALNLLSDGLAGYSISRSFRWFEYTLPGKFNFPRSSGMRAWSGKRMDEYPAVKEWLERCEEVMYAAFLRSNMYDVAPELIKDAASVGTVTPIIEEDVGNGRIIFTIPHFRENYIAENAFGQVDTHYRVYLLTLKQMVEKFGLDKMIEVKPDFEEKYKKNPYEELEIIHATAPRLSFDPAKENGKNKPFASMWVLRSPVKLLQESGYHEGPITWRWRKNNDEWYGRSPAWDAYIDIMVANAQGETNLVAGHKMVEPPMVAPADLRGLVQSGPAGWTWLEGKVTKDNMPLPLLNGIQLPYAQEQQDRTDEKIKQHFHVDFFLMMSNLALTNRQPITATQVIEMGGEKAAVLGPRIGRLESECMNPIHDRVWAIEKRAGRLPDPPQILVDHVGTGIEIDYMGPLSQAQKKLFKSQGIRSGLDSAAGLISIHPDTVHAIEPYETMKDLLESSGFPSKDIRSKEEFDKVLDAEKQKQAVQEAIQAGTEIAGALPDAGKAPEEGSLLDKMTTEGGL